MEMSIVAKAVAGITPLRGMRVLIYVAALLLSMFMITPASSADDSAEDFTRIAWLSRCEVHEQVEYFFIDLLPDGLLRYEGVTDVKILGTREERLDGRTLRRLRSAIRDFLADEADADKEDNGPTFCVRVQVYKASKVVDVQSELIYANHLPVALQKINETASPRKWACPARLSSTRSGSKSAQYCDEQAFTLTVFGKTVCDPLRHVEVYQDGTVYIATRIPRGDRLVDHSYYEIGPAAVAELVELINTFEAVGLPVFEGDQDPIYRRSRPEEIEELKARLSKLLGVNWQPPEGVECDEPLTIPSEVSLRRDLDRAVKEEPNHP